MNNATSAKYNINRYGNYGMEIHSDAGKILKVFNASKDEDVNWNEAAKWGKKNFDKIKDWPYKSGNPRNMATRKKSTKRKGKSNVGTAKLKRIVAKAKTIRSKNPGKKWTNCIKEASKQI